MNVSIERCVQNPLTFNRQKAEALLSGTKQITLVYHLLNNSSTDFLATDNNFFFFDKQKQGRLVFFIQ